eukprot:181788-Hanusia_phi.AAC.6
MLRRSIGHCSGVPPKSNCSGQAKGLSAQSLAVADPTASRNPLLRATDPVKRCTSCICVRQELANKRRAAGDASKGSVVPLPLYSNEDAKGPSASSIVSTYPQRVQEVEQDQSNLADVVTVDEHTAIKVDLIPQCAVCLWGAQDHKIEVEIRQRAPPGVVVPPRPQKEWCTSEQIDKEGWAPERYKQRLGPLPSGAQEVCPAHKHVGWDVLPEAVLTRHIPGCCKAGVVKAVELRGALLGEQPAAVRAAPTRACHPADPQRHQHGRIAQGRAIDAVAVHARWVPVHAGSGEQIIVADGVGGRGGGGGAGLRRDLGEEAGAHPVGLPGEHHAHRLAAALGTGHVAKGGLDLRVEEGTGRVRLVYALLVSHAGSLLGLRHVAEALLADGVAPVPVDGVDILPKRAGVAHHGIRVVGGGRTQAGVRGGAGHPPPVGDAGDVAGPAARWRGEGARARGCLVIVPDVAIEDGSRSAVEPAQLIANSQEDLVWDPLERTDSKEASVGDAGQQLANADKVRTEEADDGAHHRHEEVLDEPVQHRADDLDDGHELAAERRAAYHTKEHVANLVEQHLGLIDEHVEPLEDRRHHLRRGLPREQPQELDHHHRQVVGQLHDRLHDGAELRNQRLHGHKPFRRALRLHLVVLCDDCCDLRRCLRGRASPGIDRLIEVQHCLCHELLVGDAVGGRVVEELRVHAHSCSLAVGALYPLDEVGHPHA